MDLDPIGVVPAEVPDDYLVAAMLPELTTTDDVFRLQIGDQLFKRLDEQRKVQNKRLIALTKAWEARKLAFRQDLVNIIRQAPQGKVATLVATTYVRKSQTKPGIEITDEEVAAAYLWLHTKLVDVDYPDDLISEDTGEVLVEFKAHVTAAGRERLLRDHQAARADVIDPVPGCTYIAPRDVVVTRGRGGPLTMEQIAAVDLGDMLPRYFEAARHQHAAGEEDSSIVEGGALEAGPA
jgi:hypothetical protein